MTAVGSIVLSVFAAVWGIGAILESHAPIWLVGVPVLVSAVIIALASRNKRNGEFSASERKRISRLVTWASAGEGVLIFVVANVLANLGRADLIAPAIAAIVGLHFLPLARLLPAPRYYLSAAAFLALALCGFAFPRPEMFALVCTGSAIARWCTAVSIIVA
jgi:hypothetical protein